MQQRNSFFYGLVVVSAVIYSSANAVITNGSGVVDNSKMIIVLHELPFGSESGNSVSYTPEQSQLLLQTYSSLKKARLQSSEAISDEKENLQKLHNMLTTKQNEKVVLFVGDEQLELSCSALYKLITIPSLKVK